MEPTLEQLLKVFISVNSDNERLLSRIVKGLIERDPIYLKVAKRDIDDIESRLLMEQTDLMVLIGVSSPQERPLVAKILARIDSKKTATLSSDQMIAAVNSKLTQEKLTYRVDKKNNPSFLESVRKVHLLRNGINNIRLFNYIDLAQDISVYANRYLTWNLATIQEELKRLENVRDQEHIVFSDEKKLRELLENCLEQTGHVALNLQNKDLNDLVRIVYYETIAARAIILAKTEKVDQPTTKENAVDYIAIILLRDEEESRNMFQVD